MAPGPACPAPTPTPTPTYLQDSVSLELASVRGLCSSQPHAERGCECVAPLPRCGRVCSVSAHRLTETLLGLGATMGHVHRSTGSRLGEAKLLCSSVLPGPYVGRPTAVCLQKMSPFGRVWESSPGKGQGRGRGFVAWQSEDSRETSFVSGRCKDAWGQGTPNGAGGASHSHTCAAPSDEEVNDGMENSANNFGQPQTSVGVLPAGGTWQKHKVAGPPCLSMSPASEFLALQEIVRPSSIKEPLTSRKGSQHLVWC